MSIETREIELADKASSWPDVARAVAIVDVASYSVAGESLLGIKALRVVIGEEYDKPIAAAHAMHKDLLARKARHEAPLAEAERIIKTTMATWRDEQERIRRAEEARRIAEQRKIDEDKRLAVALALEEQGKSAAANAVINLPIAQTRVAKVESVVPKVAGVTFPRLYSAEVYDILELAAHVLDHPEDADCLMANMPTLNRRAVAAKESLTIPGVRLVVTVGGVRQEQPA